MEYDLYNFLRRYTKEFNQVVQFDNNRDKLLLMDFTAANSELTDELLSDTDAFSVYVTSKLEEAEAKYGIGGYNEHRTIYSRSSRFDGAEEPRRLHLGIDIWGEAGTPIYAPLDGHVHSFAFNKNFGDYGATIILHHEIEGRSFHTLYGHLSLRDIAHLQPASHISGGTEFAHFGEPTENGYWPPHLHFQIIENISNFRGDYRGVCKFSEREIYLANCPDPDVILGMMQFARTQSNLCLRK